MCEHIHIICAVLPDTLLSKGSCLDRRIFTLHTIISWLLMPVIKGVRHPTRKMIITTVFETFNITIYKRVYGIIWNGAGVNCLGVMSNEAGVNDLGVMWNGAGVNDWVYCRMEQV